VSDPVTYTAVLPASDETVLFVSGLLAAERRRLGTRRGRRALGCNGNGAVTGSAAGSTDYDQFTVAYLQDVSGDLTGDGQPETVVMLGCTPQPSNFSVFEVQVFTASHTLLAELPSPATLKPPTPAAPGVRRSHPDDHPGRDPLLPDALLHRHRHPRLRPLPAPDCAVAVERAAIQPRRLNGHGCRGCSPPARSSRLPWHRGAPLRNAVAPSGQQRMQGTVSR